MSETPGDEAAQPTLEVLALSPFSALLGPIRVRWEPTPMFEADVREDCANSMGTAHGGYLSALVDITTGQGVKRILGGSRSLVTVTSTIEFLRTAKVGERLQIDVSVEHSTDAMVFASCRVRVAERPVAIASSVFSSR